MRVVVAGAGYPSYEAERSALARAGAELVVADGLPAAEIVAACTEADGILTDYFPIRAETIRALMRCRIICAYGVGLNQVDVSAATDAGIVVSHTPECCIDEVADHTLALVLAATRNVALLDRGLRAGSWDYRAGPELRRLAGRTLGLVGFGRIARAVAHRASAFGLLVVAFDPNIDDAVFEQAGVGRADLATLLARSDILSVHVPLTAQTRGLIGPDELAALRPGAVVVNTARGGVVDEAALTRALSDGVLAAAGLDVFEHEPLAATNPLLGLDNVVLTPHAAYYSIESQQTMQEQAAEEVRRVLMGEPPLYAVNSEVLTAR